ncbi:MULTISPECIES: CbiX/SirB N-terminal domain-containing protein [Salinicola]|uniref:sirohydrochlorin chelatase n=1 Tax=Salinicola TaxID=404432 RepID=UPI0008DCFBAE|nr:MULTISPECIES: CbiX/SirB N-terminal domain-containing protein [Salinicola]OHZ03205.1 cobalamin biosynthesis protein CbiX [Salinicola sp. MIT1003]
MTQSAMILLAHGSSDARWRAPFETLEQNLQPSDGKPVVLAFTELSEPSLEPRVAELAAQGISRIEILPLFFAAGRHLREGVPGQLEEIARQHPVSLHLLDPVGQHPAFVDALASIVESQAQDL